MFKTLTPPFACAELSNWDQLFEARLTLNKSRISNNVMYLLNNQIEMFLPEKKNNVCNYI